MEDSLETMLKKLGRKLKSEEKAEFVILRVMKINGVFAEYDSRNDAEVKR